MIRIIDLEQRSVTRVAEWDEDLSQQRSVAPALDKWTGSQAHRNAIAMYQDRY